MSDISDNSSMLPLNEQQTNVIIDEHEYLLSRTIPELKELAANFSVTVKSGARKKEWIAALMVNKHPRWEEVEELNPMVVSNSSNAKEAAAEFHANRNSRSNNNSNSSSSGQSSNSVRSGRNSSSASNRRKRKLLVKGAQSKRKRRKKGSNANQTSSELGFPQDFEEDANETGSESNSDEQESVAEETPTQTFSSSADSTSKPATVSSMLGSLRKAFLADFGHSEDHNLPLFRRTAKAVVLNSTSREAMAIMLDEAKASQVTDIRFWKEVNDPAMANCPTIALSVLHRYFMQQLFSSDLTTNETLMSFIDFSGALALLLQYAPTLDEEALIHVVRAVLVRKPALGQYLAAVEERHNFIFCQQSATEARSARNPRIKDICLKRLKGECYNAENCKRSHACIFCGILHSGVSCFAKGLQASKAGANNNSYRGRNRNRRNRGSNNNNSNHSRNYYNDNGGKDREQRHQRNNYNPPPYSYPGPPPNVPPVHHRNPNYRKPNQN